MEVTSTASQASLHLPISLAFNGLERRGLIFKPSLSIRLFFSFFLSKSLIRNSRQLPKLPRLDQRPSHSIWRLSCTRSKDAVERVPAARAAP